MLITKFHRDTQTTETVHNRVQPLREHGTQMVNKQKIIKINIIARKFILILLNIL